MKTPFSSSAALLKVSISSTLLYKYYFMCWTSVTLSHLKVYEDFLPVEGLTTRDPLIFFILVNRITRLNLIHGSWTRALCGSSLVILCVLLELFIKNSLMNKTHCVERVINFESSHDCLWKIRWLSLHFNVFS